MDPIITAGGVLAGKKLFEKVVLDLYQFLVLKTDKKIKLYMLPHAGKKYQYKRDKIYYRYANK